MVDKDYNHPCVILYSTGNEVAETAQPRGIALAGEMTQLLHSLDSTRPVTCGINIFFNFLNSIGFGQYSDEKAEKEAAKAAKAKAESLRGFLSRYLNGKKFESAKVAMSFRKSEAVEFDAKCIGDVPEEFLKFKDPELDKVAVKKAIKAGETVPGCELVARQNLQIK